MRSIEFQRQSMHLIVELRTRTSWCTLENAENDGEEEDTARRRREEERRLHDTFEELRDRQYHGRELTNGNEGSRYRLVGRTCLRS